MKCVAKTVSGATAEIDVEPTDTLAELKVRFLVLRQRCDSSRLAFSRLAAPTRLDLPQWVRRGLAHKRAGVRWFAESLPAVLRRVWMAFFAKSVLFLTSHVWVG